MLSTALRLLEMPLFLLCLSLLATTQARIPLRYSNSTLNSSLSNAFPTTTSTALVGNYIAAGLGLSSSETHSSSTLSLITSTPIESSNKAEEAQTSIGLSSSSTSISTAIPQSFSSSHELESATNTAQPRTSSSETPIVVSNTSTSSRHASALGQVAIKLSSTTLASNATASNRAFALVTAPTTSTSGTLLLNASSTSPSRSFAASIHGTASKGNETSPANATIVDQCWTQWSSYWSIEESTQYTVYTGTDTLTIWTYSDVYSTYEYTTTSTEYNGNFATATETETFLTTSVSLLSLSPTQTYTNIWTRSGAVSTTFTTPPCVLPSSVSQCQASWSAYYSWLHLPSSVTPTNFVEQPSCTQAVLTGAICSTAVSDWLESVYGYDGGETSGKAGLTASWYNVTSTSSGAVYTTSTPSYYWPTSSTIVPGCTLGCQSCRVSGNQVKLLYWPPETSSVSGVVTTTAYGTTLTSPTVYISFDSLWGLNSCSDIGTPMTNVIVPITNTASMSSIYGWNRYGPAAYLSASFNFTDLYNSPVPDSIYASQPRCASSSIGIEFSCLAPSTPYPAICTEKYPCARTLPYEPVISVPAEVRNLQPAWADCIGGLNGVYDPPQALHEAASEALPAPPTPTHGGSTAAQTTHQSESSPDSTTPAAPSPAAPQVVSPTKPVPGPEPVQTDEPSPNQPAQTQDNPSNGNPSAQTPNNNPSNGDPPVQSPANTANDNPTVQTPNSPSHGDPPADSPSPADPAPHSSNDEPSNQSSPQGLSAPNAEPSPSNALEVLTQAESNPQAPAFPANAAPQPSSGGLNTPQQTQGLNGAAPAAAPPQAGATWTASDGTVVSAHQQGSNMVIAAPENTAVVSPNGGPVTIAGQTISQDGSSNLVVDGSSVAFPAAIQAPPASVAAVWTAQNGDLVSAMALGNGIVVGDSHTSVTVAAGANAVFNGQTISAAPGGGALVVDGSSLPLPQPGSTAAIPAAVVTASNGDIISAIAQGSNIVVQDGGSALTIAPGSSAVIDGQTITAASDGNAILVHGSTIAVPSAKATDGLWTASNGQVFSIMTESNGDIEVIGQSSTMTLTAGGSFSVLDDQTLSALPSGQGLVVDGSSIAKPSAAATWTAADGSTITAAPQGGDDVVLVDDGRTITLDASDGSTILDAHTVSVLVGGSAVVIDGTTLSVSRTTTERPSNQASISNPTSTQGGQATAAAPTSTSGDLSSKYKMLRDSMGLLRLVAVIVIVWL